MEELKYFGEKSQQIEPSSFKAFGIQVDSRYGHMREIVEMMNFARMSAIEGVHLFVKEVFYDSNNSTCSIELSDDIQDRLDCDVAKEVYRCAMQTISQFVWDGVYQHGIPLQEAECAELEAAESRRSALASRVDSDQTAMQMPSPETAIMNLDTPPNFPYQMFMDKLETKLSNMRVLAPDKTVEAQFEDVDWSAIQFGQPNAEKVPEEVEVIFKKLDTTNLVSQRADFSAKGIARYRYQDVDNQDHLFERECEIKGRVIYQQYPLGEDSRAMIEDCEFEEFSMRFQD